MPKTGQSKIRIYLHWRGDYYAFCWIDLLDNGSFSFGFLTKIKFTEIGSAIVRSGVFTKHTPILTSGNVDIVEAETPHVTFHPPRIWDKSGIAQMVVSRGNVVDRLKLDWFPVTSPQHLLTACSGDITTLDKITRLKKWHEVVELPAGVQFLRMDLIIFPRSSTLVQLHDPNAITNIHGCCPNYIVNCRFYSDDSLVSALYWASDQYLS